MTISISDVRDPPAQRDPKRPAAGSDLKSRLRREALDLGFETMRVAAPGALGPAGERLMAFLAAGRHGDMAWMERNAERRADPRVLWPEVRSVVMLAMSYAPAGDPQAVLAEPGRAAISVYAQGSDYHDVLKAKLRQLAALVATLGGAEAKIFVDTAPLMEKPLAAASGIGWQGKHTNLVSRRDGSWFFLAALLTDAALEPDAPEQDHCGTCRRCLDVCPTAAFPEPYQLDARRCISYLTIEHQGHIAPEFRRAIGNRVFGCDDCLAVCPWNKFAQIAREVRLAAPAGTAAAPLADLLGLDDAAFRRRFAGTAIKRTGRDRFTRNVLIAAGNSQDPSLVPPVCSLLADGSPLVRAMAVWALRRLADPETIAEERGQRLPLESDADVRGEWLRETVA